MQRATKAELQMLREIAWLLLPNLTCEFCHLSLLPKKEMTFGHRRHPPVNYRLTVHHRDRNRDNNNRGLIPVGGNLALAHKKCHEAYHANDRRRTDDPTDGE